MSRAIKQAGIAPEDVDYINAHGTSTTVGDIAETRAITSVFGEYATSKKLPISSTKSQIGHLLGAAGGIECIFTILAMNHGILPPTKNLNPPDPECNLNYIPNEPMQAQVEIALSNSFGFGGHNASLIFRRFNEK